MNVRSGPKADIGFARLLMSSLPPKRTLTGDACLSALCQTQTFNSGCGMSLQPLRLCGKNSADCAVIVLRLCKDYAGRDLIDNNFRQGRAIHSTFYVTRVAIGQDRLAGSRLW